jgi:hypothetical protein
MAQGRGGEVALADADVVRGDTQDGGEFRTGHARASSGLATPI